ncbi:Gag-Pro-Pol polyprotein [Cucumispora dikerogammari]|nr:Gag-Pro-Pol polyprotein [Cucumispora dikerogammari]
MSARNGSCFIDSACAYIPSCIRERLIVDAIDLSQYAESNNGIRYIFTMVDSFSKFSFCYPTERKTSTNFLKAVTHLYMHEGCWRILHSDNDGEFLANNVKNFSRSMSTKLVQGAPHRT